MTYATITVSLLIAFLLTFIFSRSFRSRGPFGGLLLFFLIIFLTTWSGQLWISPLSSPIWGVDWALLLFTAIIFSLLMLALSAPAKTVTTQKPSDSNEEAGVAIGIFFWILLIVLVLSIISGYYKQTLPHKVIDDSELISNH